MVVSNDVVNITFKTNVAGVKAGMNSITNEAKKAETAFDRLQTRMKILDQAGEVGRGKALGLPFKTALADVKKLGTASKIMGKDIEKAFKRGRVAANIFDARLLSLLFGGMALKRAFGGILRAVTDTFKKAEGDTSGLAFATIRLSAAWEFFKFSIFDALNTDFFIGFIDGLIRVIDWFSQLDRTWKIVFLIISVGLFALGTALLLIGQIGLGWRSIFGVGGFLAGKGTILKGLASIFTAANLIKGLTIGLGILVALSTYKILSEDGTTIGERVANVAGFTAFGAMVGAWIGNLPGAVIGAAIGFTASLIINIVDIVLEKKNREAFRTARKNTQLAFNELFAEGLKLDLDTFTDVIGDAISQISQKDISLAFKDLQEQFQLGIIDEDAYRQQAASLVGAIEKTGDDFITVNEEVLKKLSSSTLETINPMFRQIGSFYVRIGDEFQSVSRSISDGIDNNVIRALNDSKEALDLTNITLVNETIPTSNEYIYQLDVETEAIDRNTTSQIRNNAAKSNEEKVDALGNLFGFGKDSSSVTR